MRRRGVGDSTCGQLFGAGGMQMIARTSGDEWQGRGGSSLVPWTVLLSGLMRPEHMGLLPVRAHGMRQV